MSKKLFVGRLPFDFTNEKLEELFSRAGSVQSALMIPDPKNGRSRGFGFVTMKNDADTEAAIKKFNGTRLGEKDIWVTEAKEKIEKAAKPPKMPSRGEPESWPSGRSDSFPRERNPFARGPQKSSAERRPNRFGSRFNKNGPR